MTVKNNKRTQKKSRTRALETVAVSKVNEIILLLTKEQQQFNTFTYGTSHWLIAHSVNEAKLNKTTILGCYSYRIWLKTCSIL